MNFFFLKFRYSVACFMIYKLNKKKRCLSYQCIKLYVINLLKVTNLLKCNQTKSEPFIFYFFDKQIAGGLWFKLRHGHGSLNTII